MLLDAERFGDKIRWDKKKEDYVYRKNNKPVSQKDLYRGVAKEIGRYEQKIEKTTNKMINRNISFEQWQGQMKEYTKQAHVNMARLGRGGKENTFGIHYLETGNDLRTLHYPKLRAFAQEIKEGKLTEKQIITRAKLYATSSKTSFEKTRVGLVRSEKKPMMGRRRLGSCAPHCSDCVRYAEMGWQRLEDIILPGVACQCRMNCCCSIEVKPIEPEL